MDEVQLQMVKALFLMAWADGEASEEEIDILSNLMEKLGFPLSERVALMDAHLSDPSLAENHLEAYLPDRNSRMAAMELILTVCFSDQELAPQEMDLVHGLALRMGLDAGDLEYLRHRALRHLGN